MGYTLSKETAAKLQAVIKDFENRIGRPRLIAPDIKNSGKTIEAILVNQIIGDGLALGTPSLFIAEDLTFEELDDSVLLYDPTGNFSIGRRYFGVRYGDHDGLPCYLSLCCGEDIEDCPDCPPCWEFFLTTTGDNPGCNVPPIEGNGSSHVLVEIEPVASSVCNSYQLVIDESGGNGPWTWTLNIWQSGLVTLGMVSGTGSEAATCAYYTGNLPDSGTCNIALILEETSGATNFPSSLTINPSPECTSSGGFGGFCEECNPADSFCFTVEGPLSASCNPWCAGSLFEGEWEVTNAPTNGYPGLCGYWYSENRQCTDGSNWNAQLLYWSTGLITLMFTQPTGVPGAGIGQITTYNLTQTWDCASEVTLPVAYQGLCTGWDATITVTPGPCNNEVICDCKALPATLYCNLSPDLCGEFGDVTFALTQSGTLWTGTQLLGHCDDFGETYVTVSLECDGENPVVLRVTFDSQASVAGTEYFCPDDETEHVYYPEAGESCDPFDMTFISDPMDFSAGHCCCDANEVTFNFQITE